MSNFDELEKLYTTIQSRKNSDPELSYSAKLFSKGRNKIAQKLGEEAVEVVIEAIANDKKEAIKESADLLYHLMVLWSDMNIEPGKVMQELQTRNSKSGIDEKRSRKKPTKKDI